MVPPTQWQDTINKSVQISLRAAPVSVSDDRPTCLLAYECCRVKSKSFSRFLLCSLLQTSSCFPSSPSSSCRCWVLVGCGEQACTTNCKSRFLSSLQKICIPQKIFFFYYLLLQRCICALTQGLAVSDLDISWL